MARISALDLGQGFSNGKGIGTTVEFFASFHTAPGIRPVSPDFMPFFLGIRQIAALVETFNLFSFVNFYFRKQYNLP